MKIEMELVPWVTPNFVSFKMPPRPRQEGFIEGPKLSLTEVPVGVLCEMCDTFRKQVFEKALKTDPKA